MIHVILDDGEVGSMIAIPVGKENKREWDFVCTMLREMAQLKSSEMKI